MVASTGDVVRRALGVVRPLGWLLLGLGVLSLVVAGRTHWRELVVVGVTCLLLLALCLATLAIFSRYMNNLTVNVDGNDTSPEDYSVLVTNLPLILSEELRNRCKWGSLFPKDTTSRQ